jgi:class 3 adenylate cyclase
VAELVVLSGARAGAVFELPEMPTVVGRSPEAHFQLDDPWISSMHAMFERRGAEIWVVDLESRNGTFLGTERVSEALLPPGAVLRFGRTEVRMEREETRGRGRYQPRPTPPAGPPVSRPTSRLNAPEITGPHGPVRARPEDALPLEPRPVALLRLAIHVSSLSPAPEAHQVRSAVEILQRAALAEGGVVLRQAGGALAVFGVAGPSPDDADSALRAARTALDQVEALGGGLAARAALDAGPVLLGNPYGAGGVELAALGEVADRSERLLAVAGPGEILVGPGAAGAVGASAPVAMTIGGAELSVARAARRA